MSTQTGKEKWLSAAFFGNNFTDDEQYFREGEEEDKAGNPVAEKAELKVEEKDDAPPSKLKIPMPEMKEPKIPLPEKEEKEIPKSEKEEDTSGGAEVGANTMKVEEKEEEAKEDEKKELGVKESKVGEKEELSIDQDDLPLILTKE